MAEFRQEKGLRMRDHKVNRQVLLEKLNENLVKHKADYLEAFEGFKEKAAKAVKELAKRVNSAQPHESVDLSLGLIPPRSYEKQYEEVIFCFTLDTQDEVVLDSGEMARFMMDKWDWKDSFNLTNSLYK
jgi:hypothetical protein